MDAVKERGGDAARRWQRIPAADRRRFCRALPGDALGPAQAAEVRAQFPGAAEGDIAKDSWVTDDFCMLCDEPTRLGADDTCDRHGVRGAVGDVAGAASEDDEPGESSGQSFAPSWWSVRDYARGVLLWLFTGAFAFGSAEIVLRRVFGSRAWLGYVSSVDGSRAGAASEALFLVTGIALAWAAVRQILRAARVARSEGDGRRGGR